MPDSICVVLADDHELVRRALAMVLAGDGDIEVIAEVPTADEAVRAVERLIPDVLVLDVDMPGMDAFDATAHLAQSTPDTRILFLSAYPHDHYIERALEVGARGYLSKSVSPGRVARGIREVARGLTSFSDEIQSRIVVHRSGVRLAGRPTTKASTLSPRESQVLVLIAQGLPRKQIAEDLGLSIKTIEKHTAGLMNKLDIHDRVGLSRFAIREGLIDP